MFPFVSDATQRRGQRQVGSVYKLSSWWVFHSLPSYSTKFLGVLYLLIAEEIKIVLSGATVISVKTVL